MFILRQIKSELLIKHRHCAILLLLICPLFGNTLYAQRQNSDYVDYIERYKELAIEQMKEYHIPASITLAQAVLESGAGKSELAQRSNNHFGIKCGSEWNGRSTRHTDDRRNECFRAYSSVEESYEDHSKFLLRSRYKPLFSLKPTDYKAWARGLKACGYATSPTYAERLIKLIETYELHKYDELKKKNEVFSSDYESVTIKAHKIITNNKVMCVVAKSSDTWASLAKELSISEKKLLKVNEADINTELREGDFVYLEKKQKKAEKTVGVWHKVQSGESMYDIAQKYALRLKYLYKMNYKNADYTPIVGDLLKVR